VLLFSIVSALAAPAATILSSLNNYGLFFYYWM